LVSGKKIKKMAFINPSTLYSGGQGIFDSKPFLAQYQKAQAVQAAKNEALDKYFTDLPNKINQKGTRDQDAPVINQKLSNLKQYYLQNANDVRKGGQSRYEYEKLIQDVNNTIGESQNRGKTGLELGKMRLSKENGYMFDDPAFMNQMVSHDLPVGTKGSRAFDINTATLPVRPFDEVAHTKEMRQIQPVGFKETRTVDPQDPLKDVIVKIPEFKPEQLESIGLNSLNDYHTNVAYKTKVDSMVNNPTEMEGLRAVYKTYFPDKIADTPEEFAVAYDLSKLQNKAESVTRSTNMTKAMAARQANQLKMEGIRQANRKKIKEEFGTGSPQDEIYNAMFQVGSGTPLITKGKQYTIKDGYLFKTGTDELLQGDKKITIRRDQIPVSIFSAAKKGGINLDNDDYIEVRYTNGSPVSIITSEGTFTPSMMQLFQKKFNPKAPSPTIPTAPTKTSTVVPKTTPTKTTSLKTTSKGLPIILSTKDSSNKNNFIKNNK
jgi:hypothetical protein